MVRIYAAVNKMIALSSVFKLQALTFCVRSRRSFHCLVRAEYFFFLCVLSAERLLQIVYLISLDWSVHNLIVLYLSLGLKRIRQIYYKLYEYFEFYILLK